MQARTTTVLLAALITAPLALATGNALAARDPSPNPSRDPVARGQALYATACATCHGVGGAGTAQGPPLVRVGAASADFQLTTGRMPRASATGPPRRKPPAFGERDIRALVAYVASLGEGPPIPRVDPRLGDLSRGGELFRLNCAACHSFAGNGGVLSYGNSAPSLRRSTPAQIAEAVRVGPTQMPVFGPETLSDRQVDSIVRYVRYLQRPEDPGGAPLGRVGPITEGLVALFVGLGLLLLTVRWIEARA